MKKIVLVLAVGLVLVGSSCAQKAEKTATPSGQSIALGNVKHTVEGNVVTIPVIVHGLTLVKADGDTSHKTGHFHVFIDREIVDVGKLIPKEPGIVHTADNPIKIYGLTPGEHMFHIVVGDGLHRRFGAKLHLETKVDVKGPGVQGTAPATINKGDDLTVALKAEGVQIVKANGDTSGKTGHFHLLVDPATPPKAGDIIPAAVPNKIIHTFESSTTISGLGTGEHVIWVVLGNGVHRAFDPAVMDKKTVTVT
jgi:hypothetical protein